MTVELSADQCERWIMRNCAKYVLGVEASPHIQLLVGHINTDPAVLDASLRLQAPRRSRRRVSSTEEPASDSE
jgi:hypothetical protein